VQKENIQEKLASTHASTGGFPKTKDFGDSKHIGIHSVDTFCATVEGNEFGTKEACMATRKMVNPPKPKSTYSSDQK
jgi:hypothetical protein